MEEKYKKRMIECFGYRSEDKSLKRWKEIRSRRKVLRNYLLISACKFLPDIGLKYKLYRSTGAKVGKDVSIFGSNLDIFFPDLISIGDNSIVGYLTTILTHEFVVGQWRRGPVKIGKNVTIGSMTLILPGVEIGDGATVAAYSLVNRSVGPGEMVGGVPIKRIR